MRKILITILIISLLLCCTGCAILDIPSADEIEIFYVPVPENSDTSSTDSVPIESQETIEQKETKQTEVQPVETKPVEIKPAETSPSTDVVEPKKSSTQPENKPAPTETSKPVETEPQKSASIEPQKPVETTAKRYSDGFQTDIANELFNEINFYRKSNGLSEIVYDTHTQKLADKVCDDAFYIGMHHGDYGEFPYIDIVSVYYNIDYGNQITGKSLYEDFMKSQAHKNCIESNMILRGSSSVIVDNNTMSVVVCFSIDGNYVNGIK